MKYNIDSLELSFDVSVDYSHDDVCIGDAVYQRGAKQMFYYTLDLDYDSVLNTTDFENIQEAFGDYFTENDLSKLKHYWKLRKDLFLALTNSPRCPYKIIGVSAYFVNSSSVHTYHFLLKNNILKKRKQITI